MECEFFSPPKWTEPLQGRNTARMPLLVGRRQALPAPCDVKSLATSGWLLRIQASGRKDRTGPHYAVSAAPSLVLPSGTLSQALQGAITSHTLNPKRTGETPNKAAPPLPASRLRVAVDVDEVLARFLSTLNLFCQEEYDIFHEIEEFHVYDFKQVWKCSQLEANHRVHKFFTSSHFTNGLPTIPGAYEALSKLTPLCDFVVVTSRQHVIQQPTVQWLERHFPGLFSEVYFGNHFALEGKSKPKAEICRDAGAAVLIDDNPGYALECASQGIRVLLFDWEHKYAWAKTKDGPKHPLITRVRDWMEVEQQLLLHARV